jgi:hypothetical protein
VKDLRDLNDAIANKQAELAKFTANADKKSKDLQSTIDTTVSPPSSFCLSGWADGQPKSEEKKKMKSGERKIALEVHYALLLQALQQNRSGWIRARGQFG